MNDMWLRANAPHVGKAAPTSHFLTPTIHTLTPGSVPLGLVLPCECSKVDFQEKVATLLDAVVALLGEEKPEVLQVRGGGREGEGCCS